MKNNTDIDKLLRETYSESKREKAPEGISQRIMEHIQFVPVPVRFTYQPVISKKGWVGVGFLVAFFVVLTLLVPTEGKMSFGVFSRDMFNYNPGDIFKFTSKLNVNLSVPNYLNCFAIIFPLSLLVFYKVEKWIQRRHQAARK